MPRGENSKYTDKQEDRGDHFADGCRLRGVFRMRSARRTWATVNKDYGGGENPGGRAATAHLSSIPQCRDTRLTFALSASQCPVRNLLAPVCPLRQHTSSKSFPGGGLCSAAVRSEIHSA